MKKYRNILTAAAAILTMVMPTSCQYKDLIEEDNMADVVRKTMTVDFDWKLVDSIPPSMRVVFHPVNFSLYNKSYEVRDILNSKAEVTLPVGTYNVTCWNNNTEYVRYHLSSDRGACYATTDEYDPHGSKKVPAVLDSIYGGQHVLDYPDYMVHGNAVGFTLRADTTRQTLTFTPDSMVVTVDVKLNGIAGLEWCQNIRGAVNNVAARRLMAYDNNTEVATAVMFDAQGFTRDSTVTARFYLFGMEPANIYKTKQLSGSHKMVFFFWLDKVQVFIPLDISPALQRYTRDDKYIHIETPNLGINLYDYIKGKGQGMVVDAEDWTENETIPIGF